MNDFFQHFKTAKGRQTSAHAPAHTGTPKHRDHSGHAHHTNEHPHEDHEMRSPNPSLTFTEANELSPLEMHKELHRNLETVHTELKHGFKLLKKYPKSVTFFGSARFTAEDPHSRDAELLARRIVRELHYTVVTGGGPGIMQAANRGAFNAGGQSVGITISLPHEQKTNPWVTDETTCKYFFTRKTILMFSAEAFIFYPGGYGTIDELFEALTLIQTGKIPRIPVFLMGKDYWPHLVTFLKEQMLRDHNAINPADLDLFEITDNHDYIIKRIQETPVQNWWKSEHIG